MFDEKLLLRAHSKKKWCKRLAIAAACDDDAAAAAEMSWLPLHRRQRWHSNCENQWPDPKLFKTRGSLNTTQHQKIQRQHTSGNI
jgi:hypothetical protein